MPDGDYAGTVGARDQTKGWSEVGMAGDQKGVELEAAERNTAKMLA